MQQARGALADGKLGPKTIAAMQAVDPKLFIIRFVAVRLAYLAALQTWLRLELSVLLHSASLSRKPDHSTNRGTFLKNDHSIASGIIYYYKCETKYF